MRAHVAEIAAAMGFGASKLHELVVAVNEAATNAIKHGRPYPDGTIVVRIDESDDALVCAISDNGRFLGSSATPDPLAERGRGFQLMELFADETDLSTGPEGTTVRLRKRRPADEQERS